MSAAPSHPTGSTGRTPAGAAVGDGDGRGPAWIGVDLGTSSVKAVALGADGSILASARHAYPTARPRPGVAEQDPRSWWSGLADVLGRIGADVPVRRWRALGLTAMLPTLVLLDGAHRPVAPAVTWQDDRGEDEGERWRRRLGADALYRRTGQWIDGRYLLPMAEALASRDATAAGTARYVAGAKDYLFHRLTGELWTDPSTAAGFGCYDLATGRWMADVGARWELPVVADADVAAPVDAGVADRLGLPAGLPVVLGGADSVLGALALGALEPGAVGYLAGSSTVILAPLAEPRFDAAHRFLLTPTVHGGVAAEMDLLATGSAHEWLAGLVGTADAAEAGDAAGTADAVGTAGTAGTADAVGTADTAGTTGRGETAEVRPPTFLPYLAPGEQGALWDPQLSGALVGLTLAHGRRDITRALRTGIVVESARCLAVLSDGLGVGGDVHAGGSAIPAPVAQDLADATGRRVMRDGRSESHSACGAAMLAAAAVGDEMRADGVPQQVFEPDPGRRPWWEAATERHDRLRRTLSGMAGPAGGDGDRAGTY